MQVGVTTVFVVVNARSVVPALESVEIAFGAEITQY
jgi:hypothetical protein